MRTLLAQLGLFIAILIAGTLILPPDQQKVTKPSSTHSTKAADRTANGYHEGNSPLNDTMAKLNRTITAQALLSSAHEGKLALQKFMRSSDEDANPATTDVLPR